jgi:hypothetical protein
MICRNEISILITRPTIIQIFPVLVKKEPPEVLSLTKNAKIIMKVKQMAEEMIYIRSIWLWIHPG